MAIHFNLQLVALHVRERIYPRSFCSARDGYWKNLHPELTDTVEPIWFNWKFPGMRQRETPCMKKQAKGQALEGAKRDWHTPHSYHGPYDKP